MVGDVSDHRGLDGSPVVVGVEDADESRDAAGLGYRIANASDAPLHLVNAVHDPLVDIAIGRLGLDAVAARERLTSQALRAVRDALQSAVPPVVLQDQLVVRIGRSEHILAAYVREVDAGLVVIGGKSRSGLKSRMGKGTARHLLRTTGSPLLVTGPGALEIGRVLVSLDLSQEGPRTLRFASWLAGLLGVELGAVHVVDDTVVRIHRELPFDLEQVVACGKKQAMETIWPLLSPETSRELLVGPVTESLSRLSRESGPSLLVLGSHGLGRVSRWLLGSTTEALLEELPTSLAIVPSAPDRSPN